MCNMTITDFSTAAHYELDEADRRQTQSARVAAGTEYLRAKESTPADFSQAASDLTRSALETFVLEAYVNCNDKARFLETAVEATKDVIFAAEAAGTLPAPSNKGVKQ